MKLTQRVRSSRGMWMSPFTALGLLFAVLAVTPAAASVAGTCAIGEGRWGGGPSSDAVRWTGGGDDLLIVTAGAELIVFDIETPAAPVELGHAVLQHPAEYVAVAADGQLASVSDAFDNVTLVDISNRNAPVPRGTYAWPGVEQPRIMVFRGDHLFVGVRTVGLAVLDITDPDAPAFVANYDGSVSDFVLGLALYDDYAYLGQGPDGLVVVDISNPATPQVVTTLAMETGAGRIDIVGDRAYLPRGGEGLDILDLSNPGAPTVIGNVPTSSVAFGAAPLPGDRLAVANATAGTTIFDISAPASAVELGTVSGSNKRMVAIDEQAFIVPVPNTGTRIRLMDLQTPSMPVELGDIDFDNPSVAVSVGDDYVLVANEDVVMLDTSNPVDPIYVGRVNPGHNAVKLEQINGYAVTSPSTGNTISVIDAQVSGPVVATSFDNQFPTGDLVAVGNLLYVASGTAGGLRIHDLSNPLMPQFVGSHVPVGETVAQVAVAGGVAYAGWLNDDTLLVIDVSNPAMPAGIGSYTLPGGVTDIAVSASNVFVGTTLHGVRVLHHDGVGTMTEIADIDVSPAGVTGVSVDGDRLYISAGVFSGLLIYDISSPASPQFIEQHNTAGDGLSVDASNGVIAMAEGTSGASVFGCDVESINQPPVAVGIIGNQNSIAGETIFPLSTNPNFNDPDGQALAFSATGLPPGLSITVGSGVIQGTINAGSAASYPVTITATDPFGLFATQDFVWTVMSESIFSDGFE